MDNARGRIPPPSIIPAKPIELRARGDFVDWLARSGGALAATTYNSGKLALFSATSAGLTASFWRFPRPMGLAYSAGLLAVASQEHIWEFRLSRGQGASNEIPAIPASRWGGLGRGDAAGDYSDSELCLETVYSTGRIDAHDLVFDCRGLAFVNTRFNCVARPSERTSFARTWQPWFVEGVQRNDCCHLNGLGVRKGRLAMVSAFCERGAPAAWREADRFHSGVLIDVRRNAIAARGLCMPHSPRWHARRWWFCDSGRGALCRLNDADGTWEEVAVLPGFTRGLTFTADRAVVGLSRIRKRHILDAPPVRKRFPRMRSGLWLVDSASGQTTGSLEFVRGGREVYDVAFLPTIPRLGFDPLEVA